MDTWSKRCGLASIVAVFFLAFEAFAQSPPPIADFFDHGAMRQVALSPDGRQLGMILQPRGQRSRLVVMDTDKMTAKVIASYADGDVTGYQWINDRRMVFFFRRVTIATPTAIAVNSDGSDMSFPLGVSALSTTPLRNSDSVFMSAAKYDNKGNYQRTDMWRVDTRRDSTYGSSNSTLLRAPGNTQSWLLDDAGEPAVVTVREGGEPARTSVRYRDPATREWRTLFNFASYGTAEILPHSLGPAGSSTLYVSAYNGRDKRALHVYDLAKNQLDPTPLVSLTNYDFDGSLLMHAGRVVGVRYSGDAVSQEWMDAGFKETQEKIDKLLPGTMNLVSSAVRNQTTKLLVNAYSDRIPSTFFLYDTAANKLVQLGQFLPAIDPKSMARVEMVRYPAQDGLEIPARLTLPPGAVRPRAMIVYVHAGPWTRGGSWGWSGIPQFLASRGYAVLQPEFRGSRGFGLRHFESGWKQWGLAMEDDMVAGALWAARNGYADEKRICIAGYGFGAYSALMGLARDASPFRCAVALQPITDLEEYAGNWQYFNEEERMQGIPMLLGDPEKDAAQLRATSPIHLAAKIRQPVFIAHWGSVRSIPFFHGSRMRDALAGSGNAPEWVEYSNDWKPDRDIVETRDAWTRVEKFLGRVLAAP